MNIAVHFPKLSRSPAPSQVQSRQGSPIKLPPVSRAVRILFRSETGGTTENTIQDDQFVDMEQRDQENLLSLVFGSIEDEDIIAKKEAANKKSLGNETELCILKTVEITEHYKIVLCYDRSVGEYQLWKKYKPKYLKLAIHERSVMANALDYKDHNHFQWVVRNDHHVEQQLLKDEMHQMMAAQIKVSLVNPLIQQGQKFPNLQVVIFASGVCNLMEFAQSRLSQRRDPFLLSEATYIFWYLVYAAFQLKRAGVQHESLHPRYLLLWPMKESQLYELRMYNFVTQTDEQPIMFFESLLAIFATILELYGYKQPSSNDVLGQSSSYLKNILNQFPSLVEVQYYLMEIYTAEDYNIVIKQFEAVYPKKFVSAKKHLIDKEELVKELELDMWQIYFKQRGMSKFDHKTLVTLGLVDIHRKVAKHIAQTKQMRLEERSQEILEGVLDPLVKRYTRNEFMSILDRFRTALHAKEYSALVECYVAQSRFYEQMGEIRMAVSVLESSEKLLINIIGERYFQRCLEVYERQASLYLELGNYERAMDKQKLSMQLILRLKAAHNQHLKNAMVLLYCQILDAKGQTDQAIQELFNIIFKLEQKEEKKQAKGVDSKKRMLQLTNYYDALCQMYWRKGLMKLCLSYQEKSLEIKELYLHTVHPDVVYSIQFIQRITEHMRKPEDEEMTKRLRASVQSIRTFFYLCLNDVERLEVSTDVIRALSKRRPIGDVYDPIYRKVCVFQCFAMVKRICGPESTEFHEECLRMVQVCYELGQLDEARIYLDLLQRALEETIPSAKLKPIYYEQCQILYEIRDFPTAQKGIEKLMALFDENQSLDYAASLALRAAIYSEMGHYDEAIEFKEESIKLKINILGEDHVEVTTAQKALLTLKKARRDRNAG